MSSEQCRAILLLHENAAMRRVWEYIRQEPGITGWQLLSKAGLKKDALLDCLRQMREKDLVRGMGLDLGSYLALSVLSYSVFDEV